jgi:hypothetical protein
VIGKVLEALFLPLLILPPCVLAADGWYWLLTGDTFSRALRRAHARRPWLPVAGAVALLTLATVYAAVLWWHFWG